MLLADICSYAGRLPTGAPTSPAIANIIMKPVDRALGVVAARYGIAYTRYADDLTFSGGDGTPRILPFAQRLLWELGYVLDEKKTNLFRRGAGRSSRAWSSTTSPTCRGGIRRRLRAAVHRKLHGGARPSGTASRCRTRRWWDGSRS
jgi:RNA-directed DNA polymerase